MLVLKKCSLVLSLVALLALGGCGAGSPAPQAAGGTNASPSPAPSPSTDLTVSAPSNGATVSSPFTVTASGKTCSSQSIATMAYALDAGADTTIPGTSIDAQVTAAAGAHTLHVKAWTASSSECDDNVSITVAPAPPPGPSIPLNAISVVNIQALSSWQANHDPATGGSSSGMTSIVGSPSKSGQTRQFNTAFSSSGGEVYHVTFASDPNAMNFAYDAWVYLTSSASSIANLEMDMNQVIANGDTIIYGFQCDGYSGTWDYTENSGTPANPSDTWVHSGASCDVRNWAQNAWHHIQVTYSRDSTGAVTYHSIWLDGVENKLNVTVPSAFVLGWTSVLLTNFQIDGRGSGSDTTYLDELTISRW